MKTLFLTVLRRLERFFASCERRGHTIFVWVTYFVLLVLNPGHSLEEVEKGALNSAEHSSDLKAPTESATEQSDLFLAEAGAYLQEQKCRQVTVDDKNKVLLTVSSIFLAAQAAVATQLESRWILLFPFLPTMCAIFLILRYFGIGWSAVVNPQEVDWTTATERIKHKLATQYIQCALFLIPRIDFRVGLYRASLRALQIGALCLLPVFIYGAMFSSREGSLLKTIQSSAQLKNELRGITGPEGPRGPQGERGPTATCTAPTSIGTQSTVVAPVTPQSSTQPEKLKNTVKDR